MRREGSYRPALKHPGQCLSVPPRSCRGWYGTPLTMIFIHTLPVCGCGVLCGRDKASRQRLPGDCSPHLQQVESVPWGSSTCCRSKKMSCGVWARGSLGMYPNRNKHRDSLWSCQWNKQMRLSGPPLPWNVIS